MGYVMTKIAKSSNHNWYRTKIPQLLSEQQGGKRATTHSFPRRATSGDKAVRVSTEATGLRYAIWV